MLLEHDQDLEHLRYPIGRFQARAGLSSAERAALIDDIAAVPAAFRAAVAGLSDAQFERAFLHPELDRVTLGVSVQLYAWHGRHHLAHITRLRERMGW